MNSVYIASIKNSKCYLTESSGFGHFVQCFTKRPVSLHRIGYARLPGSHTLPLSLPRYYQ